MFTGIITDIGTIMDRDAGRFTVACSYDAATIAVGASIACDGCCLTATSVTANSGGTAGRTLFTVDASNETLHLTTLGTWQIGRRINLERSLALGAELGGHLVTGHVDGLATIVSVTPDGISTRYRVQTTQELSRLIARKGSVALDGTSLTVNDVDDDQFGINLIPHSLAVTTWGERRAGDTINLEVDLLARYVARLHETERRA
jgi:riboflavin synthase